MKKYDHLKKTLFYVDDRQNTLVEHVLARQDVNVVLLRFKHVDLPISYVDMTSSYYSIVVDMNGAVKNESEKVEQWLIKNQLELDYFLNPSEPAQYFSQEMAFYLNLPHLSKKQVEILRNKKVMKTWLSDVGFNVAPSEIINNQNFIKQILNFSNEHGWPVVIKPIDGYATIDTSLLFEKDLGNYKISDNKTMLLEKFLDGIEYECCALISHKKVLDVYISYMPAAPIKIVNGDINSNITLSDQETKKFPADMHKIVQDMMSKLEIDHGYLHMEFFIKDGVVTIGEIGLRIAGCEIPANHGYARGFNIYDTLIDIHLLKDIKLNYTSNQSAGDLLFPIKSGVIKKITSLDDLLKNEGVVKGKIKVQVGDLVNPIKASHSSSGFIHVVGNNTLEIEKKMRNILSRFVIEVDRD